MSNTMKFYFEEILMWMSIISTILCFGNGFTGFGYFMAICAVFNFVCACKYAIKSVKEDEK